jgi:hypothetical protein
MYGPSNDDPKANDSGENRASESTSQVYNLYSLMHWDYWIRCACLECHHAEHGFASNHHSNGKPRCGENRTSGLERGMGKTTWSNP